MNFVMIVSVLWVANGVPVSPSTSSNMSFKSKELCESAVAAVVADMTEPMNDGVKAYVRAVCIQRK